MNWAGVDEESELWRSYQVALRGRVPDAPRTGTFRLYGALCGTIGDMLAQAEVQYRSGCTGKGGDGYC